MNLGLGISFGGSKLALGLVARDEPRVLARSGRLEWHPLLNPSDPLRSLLAMVARVAGQLLEEQRFPIKSIQLVGIAWPGPGEYSRGFLKATFLPGFEHGQHLYGLLREQLRHQFGKDIDALPMASYLDACARARGEAKVSLGGFRSADAPVNGALLNIATGIAGAIVSNGKAILTLPELGETYGQWGRFLLRNKNSGRWRLLTTVDGSVPSYDRDTEVRFTDWSGGPALARRLAASIVQMAKGRFSEDLLRAAGEILSAQTRPPMAERELLIAITREAGEDQQLRALICQAGKDIGLAMSRLRREFGTELLGTRLVLTGGIGEFFGLPDNNHGPDLLVEAVQASIGVGMEVIRSQVGLDAELIGCAL